MCESIALPLDLAAARREACNGSHKLGERNNVPTLKMEKWK
jgi:hypothetical protein